MIEKINWVYFFNFYKYLLKKKWIDLAIFVTITFILTVLPYFFVWLKIIKMDYEKQRIFFGDGSIIALCLGIMCTYFAILFDYKNENEKKINIFINLILIIFYIILLQVFMDCQLNFNRSWSFINQIVILTGVVLFITFIGALFLKFRVQINYEVVTQFMEEENRIRQEKKALKTKKSKSGVEV